MLGSLLLPSQTCIEDWAGRLAFKLAVCLMSLITAPHLPQGEQAIFIRLRTPSMVCIIHILVTQTVICHQTGVIAAGLHMPLFQVIPPTITPASLVEVMCRQRQQMKYHSVFLTGLGFLTTDLHVFENQNNQCFHMKQHFYKMR